MPLPNPSPPFVLRKLEQVPIGQKTRADLVEELIGFSGDFRQYLLGPGGDESRVTCTEGEPRSRCESTLHAPRDHFGRAVIRRSAACTEHREELENALGFFGKTPANVGEELFGFE